MNNPELILYPNSEQWVLNTTDGRWHVPILSDATTLAGFVPSQVAENTVTPIELEIDGRAYIYNVKGKECLIDLVSNTDSIPPRQIIVDYCLDKVEDNGEIEFLDGFGHDAWIQTEAKALLVNISTIGFIISLPEEEDFETKTLNFDLDGQRVKEIELPRGINTEVWLDVPFDDGEEHELRIYSAYAEPMSHDERPLGFSLKELNINLTNWELYGVIYDKNTTD